jgi:hypothetical protein
MRKGNGSYSIESKRGNCRERKPDVACFPGQQRRFAMTDVRSDPNFPRDAMREYDTRVQWAAVAVILMLCGAVIAGAAFYSGGDREQTAMNSPDLQTVVPATPAPARPQRP